ncbi:MAG: M20/M25/M40 family metallo-hydrolase [Planctomyces sp.]|nr:M20/M25/M40 family metallo-hydrolase [Planctomyces sp.]
MEARMPASDAWKLLLELLEIPGRSGEEARVADFVVQRLLRAGVPDSAIAFDDAHRKSPIGGEVGNLIVRLPGTVRGPRRLLMAHLDTVPLCIGARPVRKGTRIVSADPATALGGDDRAGATVVLHTALKILQQQLPHPPLTLLWSVQEEIGLVGARHLASRKLGNPKLCFNWDGGAANVLTVGATGADNLDIAVHGRASHAGAHPERGVSAVALAALAIAELQEAGWHGLVTKGRRSGTSNIGVVRGGEATNVVTDRVDLRAEIRSHEPAFRQRIGEAYVAAFARAARQLRSSTGEVGSVEFDIEARYEAFLLDRRDPSVAAASAAIAAAGLAPELKVSNGGLDANWLTAHGFPTVTLGCGQDGIHTTAETLHLDHFDDACRIALELATAV